MKKTLILKSFMAYSSISNKYFCFKFGDKMNIVFGLNTSGKSTLFQTILYTFGINENNLKLKEILDEQLIFRLDCEFIPSMRSSVEKISFIRDDDTLYIHRKNKPTERFSGINGNSSVEHIKLKEFIHNLFECSLLLESQDEYKPAPIETLFLPYYVSQSVGWVYLRKSFSCLDYYRNFKNDYLDYYLGIENSSDRIMKKKLENQIKSKEEQIDFYSRIEKNNEELEISKLADEKYIEHTKEYIESHKERISEYKQQEKEYVNKCNELTYYKQRLSVLRKVSQNHKGQNPANDFCPVCTQSLPYNIESSYKYIQESYDIIEETKLCSLKIKQKQSEVNSLSKSLEKNSEIIKQEFNILKRHSESEITYDNWLKDKTNIELVEQITHKLGNLTKEKNKLSEELEDFKSFEDITKDRNNYSKIFERIFSRYLRELKVKPLNERRYRELYMISAFPSQGVELHKTVLAYHFAFNYLINQNEDIHRLPFILDAIFKEDLEQVSKDIIIKFVSNFLPIDTQTFISIAVIEKNKSLILDFNRKYFQDKAKLIEIGECKAKRSLLKKYDNSLDKYISQTLEIMNIV
ncbi:MAG: hypothetical protein P9L97_05080 [Candidatus Tenebribacter davisii]|nr:hypothetical protein [Candidatus Tenebribacter davisii]